MRVKCLTQGCNKYFFTDPKLPAYDNLYCLECEIKQNDKLSNLPRPYHNHQVNKKRPDKIKPRSRKGLKVYYVTNGGLSSDNSNYNTSLSRFGL